jgi:hypothetical protein
MHALSRHPKTIPADLLPISNISPKTNTGEFFYPPVPELQKYTVLVVTLVTAGTRTRCKCESSNLSVQRRSAKKTNKIRHCDGAGCRRRGLNCRSSDYQEKVVIPLDR